MMHGHSFALPDPSRRTGPLYGAAHDLGRYALWALCAGALVWNGWRLISRTHQLRVHGKSGRVPEPLQTWEGEGGRPDEPGSISQRRPAPAA